MSELTEVANIWADAVRESECWTWSGSNDIARFGRIVIPHLQARLNDLLRDAARYRWLRDEASDGTIVGIWLRAKTTNQIDILIDAEIAKERGE